LSLRAGVSIRHISFLETGRSRPSEPMIARLARALQVETRIEDELRVAAGLLPRTPPAAFELASKAVVGSHVFDTALQLGAAARSQELIEVTRPLLAYLGIRYFFCATLSPSLPLDAAIAFDEHGVFPAAWLRRCREQRYRQDDPLVREAFQSSSAFFWADVAERPRGLTPRERLILDEAGEFDIQGGFVATMRRADGTIRAVSMMGERFDARDSTSRLALRTVGTALLDAKERLTAGVPG
jgi:transcriptional regulator with XRE-family HTH domain